MKLYLKVESSADSIGARTLSDALSNAAAIVEDAINIAGLRSYHYRQEQGCIIAQFEAIDSVTDAVISVTLTNKP